VCLETRTRDRLPCQSLVSTTTCSPSSSKTYTTAVLPRGQGKAAADRRGAVPAAGRRGGGPVVSLVSQAVVVDIWGFARVGFCFACTYIYCSHARQLLLLLSTRLRALHVRLPLRLVHR
jgi:hypothetical protein